MTEHTQLDTTELQSKIRQREIKFAGNIKLKIYGSLHCASGKRMKKENRVFFKNEKEAIKEGFRPCGHCMRKSFLDWKAKQMAWHFAKGERSARDSSGKPEVR